MNDTNDKLAEIRKEIDSIDSRLLKLFNERARNAIEIGVIKSNEKQKIYDPEREREIIKKMLGQNEGPLDEKAVIALFQRLIDESRKVEINASKTITKPKN